MKSVQSRADKKPKGKISFNADLVFVTREMAATAGGGARRQGILVGPASDGGRSGTPPSDASAGRNSPELARTPEKRNSTQPRPSH